MSHEHKDEATTKKAEKMLTTTELSQLLHVHPNTLRRWTDNGFIKTYRIGTRGDRRFRQDDIQHFLIQTIGLSPDIEVKNENLSELL